MKSSFLEDMAGGISEVLVREAKILNWLELKTEDDKTELKNGSENACSVQSDSPDKSQKPRLEGLTKESRALFEAITRVSNELNAATKERPPSYTRLHPFYKNIHTRYETTDSFSYSAYLEERILSQLTTLQEEFINERNL